ncbi:hypothetical protein KI387_027649, partial [Taxus chinensis]
SCSFTLHDMEMEKSWPKIIKPRDEALKSSLPSSLARRNSKWSPPPPSFFKIDFDGAARGNPGASSAGCLVRNSL